MDGAFDLASSGMAYLQPRNTPSALTAMTRRHSAKLVCSTSPGVPTPALLTRPSRRPWRRSISAMAACQSSSRRHVEGDVHGAARGEIAADGGAAGRLDGGAHGAAERAERAGDENDVVLELRHYRRFLLHLRPNERPMLNMA